MGLSTAFRNIGPTWAFILLPRQPNPLGDMLGALCLGAVDAQLADGGVDATLVPQAAGNRQPHLPMPTSDRSTGLNRPGSLYTFLAG
jgi:hypothetical protein